MKEKRSFKRFDLLSALAVLGVLLILLFECIFIFELYNIRFEPLDRFFLQEDGSGLGDVQPSDGASITPPENPAAEESSLPVPATTNVPLEDVEDPTLSNEDIPPVG